MFKKKESKFKFNLGDVVRDVITGYCGIMVVRCQWLHNCNTYGIKVRELKDGKPLDLEYFDEPQLKLVTEKVMEAKQETGGLCQSVRQTNR